MRIGPFEIGAGAALAPMAGVTDPPFRRLCRELGAAFAVTELVSCHAVLFLAAKERNRARVRGVRTLSLMEPYPGERPFFVQLYGREPRIMAEAARVVAGEGADVVDLNFGCPARKVIKGGEGGGVALMRDPGLLFAIASEVVRAANVPVTAKIRLGWSRTEKNAVEVARLLEDAGVQAICVHARTREQGHGGPVDLEALRDVVAAVRVPVVGNGGVRSRLDAEEMIAKTGCARVAVGQGAKGNPWIFREIAGGPGTPDLADRIATCRRHLEMFAEWAGEARAAIQMRKHACWYLRGFDGAAAFRKRLGSAIDAASFGALLDEIPT